MLRMENVIVAGYCGGSIVAGRSRENFTECWQIFANCWPTTFGNLPAIRSSTVVRYPRPKKTIESLEARKLNHYHLCSLFCRSLSLSTSR